MTLTERDRLQGINMGKKRQSSAVFTVLVFFYARKISCKIIVFCLVSIQQSIT